ncbi:MAG: hypothetical protein ACR2NA_05140 [Solirubrobacterales bacterium]
MKLDRILGVLVGLGLGLGIILVFQAVGGTQQIDAPRLDTETNGAEADVRTIIVRGGKPDGGVPTISARRGEELKVRVESDEAGELRLERTDLRQKVRAATPVEVTFTPKETGSFDLRLAKGETLATIRVRGSG